MKMILSWANDGGGGGGGWDVLHKKRSGARARSRSLWRCSAGDAGRRTAPWPDRLPNFNGPLAVAVRSYAECVHTNRLTGWLAGRRRRQAERSATIPFDGNFMASLTRVAARCTCCGSVRRGSMPVARIPRNGNASMSILLDGDYVRVRRDLCLRARTHCVHGPMAIFRRHSDAHSCIIPHMNAAQFS